MRTVCLIGSQPKFGPASVADKRPGCDVGADDVIADAVSGADDGDRASFTAGYHVRHDEKLSAHARTADGGDGGGHSQHSGRLFSAHRLPRSSPRLQLSGKSTRQSSVTSL